MSTGREDVRHTAAWRRAERWGSRTASTERPPQQDHPGAGAIGVARGCLDVKTPPGESIGKIIL
jgi:hypothetical protein